MRGDDPQSAVFRAFASRFAPVADIGAAAIYLPEAGKSPVRAAEICSRKASMSRNDYFYVLHRNVDGRETTARKFENRGSALTALAAEVGESLTFVADGVRSGSHTLKRFANVADRPGELLETFLATSEDWVATEWPRPPVATQRRRRP